MTCILPSVDTSVPVCVCVLYMCVYACVLCVCKISRSTEGTCGAGAAVAALVSDENPHRPQLRGALTETLEAQCPENLQDRVEIQRTFENLCLGRAVQRRNGSSRCRFRAAARRSVAGRGHGWRRRHAGHRRAIVPGRVVRAAVTSALLVLHAHFEE